MIKDLIPPPIDPNGIDLERKDDEQDEERGLDAAKKTNSYSSPNRRGSIGSTISQEDESRMNRFKKYHYIAVFLEDIKTQVALSFLLIFSLYLADLWAVGNVHEKYDDILNSILVITIAIFAIECGLLVLSTEKYFLGFFFYMDVIGTLSIILDLTWITSDISSSYPGSSNVARAARVARLAARAGRLVKLLRILRVFMQYVRRKERDARGKPQKAGNNVSTLSNRVAIKLAKRVAMVVMIQILLLPLLQYYAIDHAPEVLLEVYVDLIKLGGGCNATCFQRLTDEVAEYYDHYDDDLHSLYLDGVGAFSWPTAYTRASNLLTYREGDSWVKVSQTRRAQLTSAFSVGEITLTVFLLVWFSVSFSQAMERTVVRPIDRMMASLRTNLRSVMRGMRAMDHVEDARVDALEATLETDMLEQVVEKLIKLVRLAAPHSDELAFEEGLLAGGFGGAGAPDKSTQHFLAAQFTRAGQTRTMRLLQGVAHRRSLFGRQGSKFSFVSTPSSKRRLSQVEFMDLIGTWGFDALATPDDEIMVFLRLVFDSVEASQTLSVSAESFQKVALALKDKYLDNPYHHFRHGVDVMYVTYKFIRMTKANGFMTQVDLIALLLAALAHDVGHKGVNNAYLVNIEDECALRYNDVSPLENLHCYILFSILKRPDCNLFKAVDAATRAGARKLIVQAILGTDMRHHFKQIQRLTLFGEQHGSDFMAYWTTPSSDISSIPEALQEVENVRFVLELLLHCADISGPVKPVHISKKWADLVCEEFFQQGEKEKEKGLPVSPMMDKATTNIPNMQMGFIEFVVSPIYIGMAQLFPGMAQTLDHMAENFQAYAEEKREELRAAAAAAAAAAADPAELKEEEAKLGAKAVALAAKFAEVQRRAPPPPSPPAGEQGDDARGF